ncbi:MAG: SDR family NAD(P)-dependent oxidoreductase, partial [Pseudomonadota bacterium]
MSASNRFAGKVALVTGGRSGIGRASADALAGGGARVFTAQRGLDDRHEGIIADLSDPAAPGQVIDAVIAAAGQLDILVNSAGLMREGTALEMPVEDWTATLQVNLTAP